MASVPHLREVVVIKIRHDPIRTKKILIWGILQRMKTLLALHKYYMGPLPLWADKVILSYSRSL